MKSTIKEKKEFLACESRFTFWALIFVAGIFGAYTFNLRGGVFCNAQTANMVLLGIGIGSGDIDKVIHYVIPIVAYLIGFYLSDLLARRVRDYKFLRWDTIFVGLEFIIVLFVGAMDANVPDQVVQVIVSFLCSMQFYTFREMEGVSMATTFSTNHLRQFVTNVIKYLKTKDTIAFDKLVKFGFMLLLFIVGAIMATFFTQFLDYKSIWLSCPVLLVLFVYLVINDTKFEKNIFDKVPSGH